MENRCIIISGGVFGPVPEKQPGDFIIACDRGYVYCERLGLTPDLFIGDFDSYSGAVAPGVAVERLYRRRTTRIPAMPSHTRCRMASGSWFSSARWAGGWITRWQICRMRRMPPRRACL